ncbi:D-hexose-6-phosphate mutarotase [Halochromatium glycolicum]|uniref:Putative glucose-6-phosphate 1-epimerase n=1 Tax=Halochromatium glycolicum TaxID=85075 RepID=A0AAJ0U2H2_9GAMM|nr:D-hexose-6-phosphate mutarotase [Halochromatium glycolicum]MBK1704063.1 D-hexose-6-phosphate mutarotase [Halochromatium glycolicum]
MDIAQANEEFGIPGVLAICAGNGGFPLITVENAHARASVCAHGGQVLSYCPAAHDEDLLFLSRHAYFEPGKAIKGGIPVCWPWFGPDPQQQGRPAHGFVRTRGWRLLSTEVRVDGSTRLRLGTRDDEGTRADWPYAFALEIEVTIGADLELALTTENTGQEPFTLTQALHAYFRVGDVRQTQVFGLAEYDYLDKLAEGARKTQSGPVNVQGPIDRVYLDTSETLSINDPSLGRSIQIEREGSRSAVVWNPWVEQARNMGDFGDDEYLQMLCVETTNAAEDCVTLEPGAQWRLGSRYRLDHARENA